MDEHGTSKIHNASFAIRDSWIIMEILEQFEPKLNWKLNWIHEEDSVSTCMPYVYGLGTLFKGFGGHLQNLQRRFLICNPPGPAKFDAQQNRGLGI